GTAFMEMQFYPPGWAPWPAGNSCDARQWCAALNIDSLSQNMIGTSPTRDNNQSCLNSVGFEPVNFAFITKNGVAQAPAGPVASTATTFTPDPAKDLFMNSGDQLSVSMHDTAQGFRVEIKDLTTETVGAMTASIANGFQQVLYAPTATTCTGLPYAFHPMYSTSSEQTRVPWAAHSYNVAFADEIGHFEYCGSVASNATCAGNSASDPAGPDKDEFPCFPAAASTRVQVGGCLGTDVDFDGPEYSNNWPGTAPTRALDKSLHPQAIRFSSPTTDDGANFQRVAFEADLPRIESLTNPPCQRFISNPTIANPGQGCVNPPVGASFYPFFTTRGGNDSSCSWQLGGANIPGTTNLFGGGSAAEYGGLLKLAYPERNGQPTIRYNDFRQILAGNPCRAGGDMGGGD
ncbi:MAG: hypothetical protein M3155_01410, partial [Actinomycetota bacterium]|nr:hypothetical protein [Actinomycetota bacterium]